MDTDTLPYPADMLAPGDIVARPKGPRAVESVTMADGALVVEYREGGVDTLAPGTFVLATLAVAR